MKQTILQKIPPNVTVVAVTKTFPFQMVEEAFDAGLLHIGENRVEEAEVKIEQAKQRHMAGIVWHMIGHVQSRKVAAAVKMFDWIDSVDTVGLLKNIDVAAQTLQKNQKILLEINCSGEETKFGFDLARWEDNPVKCNRFIEVIRGCSSFHNIYLGGLMTMAPYVTDAEKNRSIFRSVSALSSLIRAQIPEFGAQLSMGTSCDWQVAIEEGATQVRLGEALFGRRNYE